MPDRGRRGQPGHPGALQCIGCGDRRRGTTPVAAPGVDQAAAAPAGAVGTSGARRFMNGRTRTWSIGPEQDDQVEQQRPVVDVEQVEAAVGLERRVVPGLDLPQAGDAGAHLVAGLQLGGELGDLGRQRRPRADEAHVAAQHVEQLRQLVEAERPDKPPDPRDARVDGRA